MPTYQYSCTECGHFFEQFQNFSDASLSECPACQGKLRKVFNAVGVVFKGSGFYRNDSRSENGSQTPVSAGASKEGSSKNGSSKDGSSGSTDGGGSKDSSTKDSGGASTDKPASTSTSSGGSSSSSSGTSKSGSAA